MYQDFKDLLSALHAHSVNYLIIGGYAVALHAQPRATKALDVFIKADPANAQAVYAALGTFGAPVEDIRVEDLADIEEIREAADSQPPEAREQPPEPINEKPRT